METENRIGARNQQLPGFINLAKETLQIYKAHWTVFFSLFLLIYASSILATLFVLGSIALTELLKSSIPTEISAALIGAAVTVAIILFLWIMAWGHSAAIIALSHRSKKILTRAALRQSRPKIFAYFWTVLLGILVTAAGYIFFVIPGIILGTFVFAAGYVAVEGKEKGIDALVKSREYVRGYLLKVLLLLAIGMAVMLFVMSVIDLIPVEFIQMLASLAIMPIPVIFSYLIFEKLKHIKGDLPAPTTSQKNFFRAIAAISLTIIVFLIAIAINFAPQIKQEYEIMRLEYEAQTGQEMPRLPI